MPETDPRVLAHWAVQLDLEASALMSRKGCLLFRNERPDRLIVFDFVNAPMFAVPERFREAISAPPAPGQDLAAWLGEPIELRWRDYYYYASASGPLLPAPGIIRSMTAGESEALDTLKAACGARDLELAQITLDDPLVAGCFDGKTLIGAASLLDISPAIADIGVLTHPAWRGRGIAPALTAFLRNAVIDSGRVAQYTTMASNTGSVRTAEKCGFGLFLTETGYYVPSCSLSAP